MPDSAGRDFLHTFPDFERGNVSASETFGLARVLALLDEVGSPHVRLRVVHVAGTKGKGSTAVTVASILSAAHYKTGLFTQPHLVRINERFQIDGREIDDVALDRILLDVIGPATVRLAARGVTAIQQFEVQVALAMLWFEREQVDVAVLEVGLGGRLDATNVISRPLVTVLTPIGFDHMAVLGNTLTEIAAEKAAIVKRGVPAVASEQPTDAADVFVETCERLDAPLFMAGRDWSVSNIGLGESGTSFDLQVPPSLQMSAQHSAGGVLDEQPPLRALKTPLLGAHQAMNAGCAIVTALLLARTFRQVNQTAIRDGLAGVRWSGRLQILAYRPTVVLDGAHTAESAAVLVDAMHAIFPDRNVLLVCGIQRDKDIEAIAGRLAPIAARVYATQAQHQRAAAAAEIATAFRTAGSTQVEVLQDALQAAQSAIHSATPEDVVLITGSLYLVGELLAAGVARASKGAGGT